MANINQTVIVRTDLFNLPEDMGLVAAQVAHIHFQLNRQILQEFVEGSCSKRFEDKKWQEWLSDPYLMVKKVPNIEALQHMEGVATENDLIVREWKDTMNVRLSSTTSVAFSDVLVGISIGPDDSDKIKVVVGDLPLL